MSKLAHSNDATMREIEMNARREDAPAASPIPWEVVKSCEHHGPYVVSAFGVDVCDLYAMTDPSSLSVRNGGTSKPVKFSDADANAALIVRAVNAHDELVAALRCFLDDDRFQVAVGGNPLVVDRMLADARAALAKAEGRTP